MKYLKTKDMAKHIGYSDSYLLENRGVLFFEGTHYFPKAKRIDWKVEQMEAWVENGEVSDKAREILRRLS